MTKGKTWVVFTEAEKWEDMPGRRYILSNGWEASMNNHRAKPWVKVEIQNGKEREKVGEVR